MSEIIKYESNVNGGVTVILPDSKTACDIGMGYFTSEIDNLANMPQDQTMNTSTINVRGDSKSKGKKLKVKTLLRRWKEYMKSYNKCVDDLRKGSDYQKQSIKKLADEIVEHALLIDPSLSNTQGGWQTAENGPIADSSLVASGVPNPCFKRRYDGEQAQDGSGDGAYRIVLCTDVAYWGNSSDNSAYIMALVTILQNFGPVEVWIQQGWLAKDGEYYGGVTSGTTLFKLDADGGIDPTQLAFWCGNRNADHLFSHAVNDQIGRTSKQVSTKAEIPCDLFLSGTWMMMYGLETPKKKPTKEEQDKWYETAKNKQERLQMFSDYLIDTVKGILYEDN